MSKLFSDFSSFGPSLAESTHTQSISTNSIDSKSLQGSSSPDSDTDRDTQQRHRLRKISIHLVNEIIKMEKLQEHQQKAERQYERDSNTQIRVFCRFKPSTTSTFKYDETMVDDGSNQFSFDGICSEFATQEQVYNRIAKNHIEELLQGKNTTIFAYGQTASGKTHTMFGDLSNEKEYGIIPRSLQSIGQSRRQIFQHITNSEDQHAITCSMLEIYREKLKDLFACEKNQLKIKENAEQTYVEGLMEISVDNEEQLIDLINFGHGLRKVAQTYHNDYSSRSHTMLFIHHKRIDKQGQIRKSKLCLVDLAGSEKVSKTGATGDTLEQAKKINLSLSCLGNVIHNLTTNSDHIPYRDSKLTRILKDSLCGNYRTSIITTCSLSKEDRAETISTMKFASRAKKIKNKQRLDKAELTLQEVIRNLQRELEQTKKELDKYRQRQAEEQNQEPDAEVPEELVQSQPLKSIECNFTKLRLSQC